MNIYYIQYNIRPLPGSADFESAGGAFLICFVQAESEQNAMTRALAYIAELQWEVVVLEDGPALTHREEFVDTDPEWLEAYEGALQDGEFYALYVWSDEEHEDHEAHEGHDAH